MADELRPFQKTGSAFLQARKAALLADEMGLGKTVQAIDAINAIGAKKILVLCPAVAKLNWKREMEKWLTAPLKIQVLSGRKDSIRRDTDVVIVNYDLLTSIDIFREIIALQFAVGVFDEAHYLKSRTAKRTKAVLMRGSIASRCVYKWFLTGTPVLNRPVELYPILKAAAPQVIAPYDDFDSFARRFCDAWWDGFQLVSKGASNVDDLATRLNSGFMLRRLKKDVLKELPDKIYQIVSIPPKDKETKALAAKEFNWSKSEARYGMGSANDGAEIAVIRHQLALSKVSTALEHIEDMLVEKDKVIVFAYHKDVIAALEVGLKEYGVVTVTGDTSSAMRFENQNRFQNEKGVRVFLGQIEAAGTNLTLTAASLVIFVESSWVPGHIDQAADRAHRYGQKNSVLIQFLVIAESVEEHMLRTVIDKKATIDAIVNDPNDGTPEVIRLLS